MPRKKKTPEANPMNFTEREKLIFNMLSANGAMTADDILKGLRGGKMKLNAKRNTHSLGTLMKYMTAKACQHGYIISMVGGGRGAGKKGIYSMKYYDLKEAA